MFAHPCSPHCGPPTEHLASWHWALLTWHPPSPSAWAANKNAILPRLYKPQRFRKWTMKLGYLGEMSTICLLGHDTILRPTQHEKEKQQERGRVRGPTTSTYINIGKVPVVNAAWSRRPIGPLQTNQQLLLAPALP